MFPTLVKNQSGGKGPVYLASVLVQLACRNEKQDSGNQDDEMLNNIVIDKSSLEILKGSEVDFASELIGTSFKISNPKTKSSCGCGISFSI